MKKIIAGICICFFAVTSFAQTQTVETKKGWSQKKKGAIIGAAVGAGTGALVSNKKGKGAIIGGVVGAGAGYAYGSHRQKKHPKRTIKRKIVTTN
jgi:outer membrane lipoprotein SlyB